MQELPGASGPLNPWPVSSIDILLLYFEHFFTNMTPIYKQEQTTVTSIL